MLIGDTPGVDAPATPKPRLRRVLRTVGAATALAALACGGAYLWLDRTAEVRDTGVDHCLDLRPETGTAESLRGVCTTLTAMTEAWNRHDATAFGAVFTENATYTTYLGTHYRGRADLTAAHEALFDGFLAGTKLADAFLDARFFGDDVAVVTSRGDTYTGERPTDLGKTQTYTMVREADGAWRIASFHNTQRRRALERISFLVAPDTVPAAER
ncbi:SgcJ/EcaC family oxidoreductase [Nocardia farcinica]|uniref:SgcJ/EcaC family oxidoreductase n=1 Tax=Nocardia farcinica TaxID=37329 RepID=UPI000DFD55D1|nr:SgcJ/EcaC family oxidoreductase [Nocardia farcinica]MBA4855904.1 SgcJ/EcaC family oxidoreductase [Nocardia farcinica]MBC9818525.1 SgcJ/EcaC family oxidoreductase [Nocardia farcinica]SUE29500.1 SnoaL-like domain [Nocardia farcinica]